VDINIIIYTYNGYQYKDLAVLKKKCLPIATQMLHNQITMA